MKAWPDDEQLADLAYTLLWEPTGNHERVNDLTHIGTCVIHGCCWEITLSEETKTTRPLLASALHEDRKLSLVVADYVTLSPLVVYAAKRIKRICCYQLEE